MLIEALQKQSGVSVANLQWLALTASHRYKTYEIPKRTGGTRTIHHPSRALKGVQRWISKFLFRQLPVHQSAMAYTKGSGILRNAEAHLHSSFTVRMDFEDFFPSFNQEGVERFLRFCNRESFVDISDADIEFIGRIVCRYGHLTIGAPSSPSLTNVMMYSFDRQIADLAERRKLIYTRYADDLFLSSFEANNLSDIPDIISSIVKTFPFAPLKINNDKTAYLSRRYARRITGLVLTPDNKISIGRDNKREIKSLVHRYKYGSLDRDKIDFLSGYVSYVRNVDEKFFISLKNKYGSELIEMLIKKTDI